MDNSRHGFPAQQDVQKLKQHGLELPGTADSQTTFKESGLTGPSFVTAFRSSAVDVLRYAFGYRDLALGSGHGFATTFNSTGQKLELRVGWPDGSQGTYYQSGMSIIVNKWHAACGIIPPNRNHKLALSDGTVTAVSPAGYLANVVGSPLILGASATGSSMLKEGMGFFGTWDNELITGDTATAIAPDINIMTGRGQTI